MNNASSRAILTHYAEEQKRYSRESDEVKREAQLRDAESKLAERRALRYDVGEGLLEIGLVLSSLFFIARRRMFPLAGTVAAASGVGMALSTLFFR